MFHEYDHQGSMVWRPVCICILFCSCAAIAQKFNLKKHNFSFFIGNTHLDCRVPVTSYTYGEQNSNYYNEQFEIRNQSSRLNAHFGGGYARCIRMKKNDYQRSSVLMIGCELAYTSLDYRRTKSGKYSGGINQYFFEGTVNERYSSGFLALGLGAKYYLVSPLGEVFGLAIGVERNKSISNSYSAAYFNQLDNTSWTWSPGRGSPSQMNWKQRIKMNLVWPQDYFSLSLGLSAGKNLGKKCHTGVYIKYILPQYLFYSTSESHETNSLSFTGSSRYLDYFHVFSYGVYFMM